MNFAYNERRVLQSKGSPGTVPSADIVRHGMSLQSDTGTISAIEYLKANGIESAVIQRVLSGSPVRAEDMRVRRHETDTADV